jgi:hypothetical protein
MRRLIFAGLGGVARDYSNAEVLAAITAALINGSGVEIPSTLVPAANVTADSNQVLAAKAAANGAGRVSGGAAQIHLGKAGLAGSAAVKAN